MQLLPVVVAVAALVIFALVVKTVAKGRAAAKDLRIVHIHRRWAMRTYSFVILAILVVEGMVRLKGGLETDPLLFYLHLVFALPFVVALTVTVAWFKVTDWLSSREIYLISNYRNGHKYPAYATLVFSIGTLITGGMMVVGLL